MADTHLGETMPDVEPDFDWHHPDDQRNAPRAPSPRRRLRWVLGIYAAGLTIVLLRAVQLELSDGANFRRLASQPRERIVPLAARRGRILARDGTVLATDRNGHALAVHFRYLETPPNARWLRGKARLRLTRSGRRDPARVAAAEEAVKAELADLHHRLASLCEMTDAEWRTRALRVQRRVTTLAAEVNRRHRERYRRLTSLATDDQPTGVTAILAGLFAPPEPLPPAELYVPEQTAHHPIARDLPREVALSIEQNPDAFPGVKIVEHTSRAYPRGSLAAGIVGHVGSPTAAVFDSGRPLNDRQPHLSETPSPETDDMVASPVGLLGIEAAHDSTLSGRSGRARQKTDRRGNALSTNIERGAVAGGDVILTIDPRLQDFAEELLDRFARRRSGGAQTPRAPHGGAIVVLDVRSGEVLTAASEPRFDPTWFATGDARAGAVLRDPRRPLFDRATRMAIAPGSVFKPLVAVALLDRGLVDPQQPFTCQGYLHEPDSLRCRIFRQQGIGHGGIALADALAQSCNVYFFHHARRLGAASLVDWAARLGFGRLAAIDGPDQAIGRLPRVAELADSQRLEMFAVGQGAFTATPLQVARMYAAIANGGYLVPAQFTRGTIADEPIAADPRSPGQLPDEWRVAELDGGRFAAVREGLRRVVDDPAGTAYRTVRLPGLPIAGKTGTAQSGAGEDHAWFAGYAPADAPRYAFVVALARGGSGAGTAGPLAWDLVRRMQQLGYFPRSATADKRFPPGKG